MNGFYRAFSEPSREFGEVPFYWWSGEELNKERLSSQLEKLAGHGIAGVQVNYCHDFKGGEDCLPYGGHGRSIRYTPEHFSEKWWEFFAYAAKECERLGLGIGVGDYTLAWIGNGFFTDEIAKTPGMGGKNLSCERKMVFSPSDLVLSKDVIAVVTYPGGDYSSPVLLYDAESGRNDAGFGCCECFIIHLKDTPMSINPMHPDCGKMLVDIYFKEFERRIPGLKKGTLNYFFQDELMFGCDVKTLWDDNLKNSLAEKYGVDYTGFIPHLFMNLSDLTPKIRMNVSEMRTRLCEEGYFKPVYDFHASRGLIYGCDQSGRGKEPLEFGDYFSCVRWFTAPGNDTPGRSADMIKVKVNSSIAHLYGRPRTWLEGYHSSGWGTTLESITAPTSDNFMFGANLLNLHGLYYTTNGGFFEWAPPDFHFRMPYWDDEKRWLDKYRRLSALMCEGRHSCDTAVFYPVSSCEYGENSEVCVNDTFDTAEKLFSAGMDFDFIDRDSIISASSENGFLCAGGEKYRMLVFCSVDCINYSLLAPLKAFLSNGGHICFCGITPYISDRAGENDSVFSAEMNCILAHPCVKTVSSAGEIISFANSSITRTFLPDGEEQTDKIYCTCRRNGSDALYFVRYAKKDSVCRFESEGVPYLLDIYNRKISLLTGTVTAGGFTFIKMPLEAEEDTLILFTDDRLPCDAEISTSGFNAPETLQKINLNKDWSLSLEPTLDNTYGDFRKSDDKVIGAEARFFEITDINGSFVCENAPFNLNACLARISTEASLEEMLCRALSVPGVKIPDSADYPAFDERYGYIEASDYEISLYEQGHHGLKGKVFDENMFFDSDCVYTADFFSEETEGYLYLTGIEPDFIYINGRKTDDFKAPLSLEKGRNRICAGFVYDSEKAPQLRNGVKFKRAGVYVTKTGDIPPQIIPLAKRDYLNPAFLRFVKPGADKNSPVAISFETAPGTAGFEMTLFADVLSVTCGNEAVPFESKEKNSAGANVFFCALTPGGVKKVSVAARPFTGYYGATVIPEPVRLTTAQATVNTGDTSLMGALNCYSGKFRYKKTVSVRKNDDERLVLDLGSVGATAAVYINKKEAYVFTYSPFRCDITDFVNDGENELEIVVSNTLCNHYSTIPSRYSNYPRDAKSGLIGPVSIKIIKE